MRKAGTLLATLTAAWVVISALFLLFEERPVLGASVGSADAVTRASTPALKRLTHDGSSTPLQWTSGGDALLVQRPGQVLGHQQLSELWLLSVSDGNARLLSPNAFSPAAREGQVAYLRFADRGQWEVVVADLEGARTQGQGTARWALPPSWVASSVRYLDSSHQLASTAGPPMTSWLHALPLQPERVRLSSDGAHIAYTDGQTLWVANEHGLVPIAQGGQVYGFAWSPAGAQLAYVVSDGGPAPELRLWDAATGIARVLIRGDMEHFGMPAWSPDGRTLAFTRNPTGSGPNAAGDIWLVNSEGTAVRPLARTYADERAPCWSPDGTSLAFSVDGDVWVADLQSSDLGAAMQAASDPIKLRQQADPVPGSWQSSTGASQYSFSSLTPPATIRVKHDAAGNTCRAVPDGSIQEYPFEQYVKQVVPHEVYTSWPTETLKAQAVAARTYAWRKTLDRRQAGESFDVWDSTSDQYMCDYTYASTNAAVDATTGQYVSHDGDVIYAFFCAETGSPTNYLQQHDLVAAPYLRPVNDPVGFGQTRHGHSWGLSQWGAYRWAFWHGWEYQQILAHYYTFATVERPSTIVEPLASPSLPWPDFYVSTNYAHLQANASDNTEVLTVTFAARITDTWTVVYTDTDAADGWQYVWPLIDQSDTVTPSIGLRVTAYDGTGHSTQSGVSQVGSNRTAPAGKLAVSTTEVTTLSLSIQVAAFDPTPTGATVQMGLGDGDWVWQDSELPHSGGRIISDSTATDGSAWHVGAGTSGVLYGPYTAIFTSGRQYRAYFRLKVPTAAITSARELAKLDVATDGGGMLLGVRYVRGTDLLAGDVYQEIGVDFVAPESGSEVEFRTDAGGSLDLWVDRVRVVSYPVDVVPELDWTLPEREGPTTLVAKFVDWAGNVSPDVTLTVTVTDDSPPAEWRQISCGAVTCTVQVRDAIAGLDVTSGAFKVSTDEGLSWSAWLSAMCTGAAGSHDWETLTAAAVPVPPLTSTTTWVQFRAYDVSVANNEGQSPVYSVRRIYLPLAVREG